MRFDAAHSEAHAGWFLIACHGDLVLKLGPELAIGEDAHGGVVLCPAPDQALLSLKVKDGELVVKALALDWTFTDRHGAAFQHLTFAPGSAIRLDFPGSFAILRPTLLPDPAEKPEAYHLRPTSPPRLALTRLPEPVRLVDPALLPHPAASAGSPGGAASRSRKETDDADPARIVWLDPARLLARRAARQHNDPDDAGLRAGSPNR